ncbi:MAG: FAD-linked oxidase C-terminal domain-containing protein, partial [Dehalococcoidia bacterium]
GVEKQMYMPWAFTEEDMDAMRRLRGAFSSAGFFNPGKIFPDEVVASKAWELPRLVAQGSGMYV